MRPILASLLVLTACAHAPTTPGPAPAAPDAPSASTASTAGPPAPAPQVTDRFAEVRAAAEALLAVQGEAAWRGWTTGEPADAEATWSGREALLDPALIPQLGEAIAAASPPERTRLERLRGFLLGEQLASAAAQPARGLAAARAGASFTWEKRSVPLRLLQPLLAGEPEAPRRRAAAEAWRAAALKLEKLAATRDAALLVAGAERGLGSSLLVAGALRLEDADRLAALAEEALASGDATWPATLAALARQELAAGSVRLRECDLPRLFRTTADPKHFPPDRLLADLDATLAGLGLDLAAGGRLTVDAASRPGKLSRPLAVAVEPPGRVRLAVTPLAGLDAARALLHEAGVGLSQAHVDPAAPFEIRRLAPTWQTQAWGLLFEGIAADPEWLRAHGLSAEAAEREARVGAARRIHATRKAAASVLIEVARARQPDGAAARWAELAPRALGHPLDRGEPLPWRLEPDPFLRAADGLRAQLLATRLAATLSSLAGDHPWWRSPAVGAWLRAAWTAGGTGLPTAAPPAATPAPGPG